ncbi:hypothetical protein K474DRAFT_1711172 [Panus rudis PR-1116 ss-1]|nr:hypothetical protein K474DRAFT_1711172 [Panus rudis PR-1116 ss-1]
MSVTSLYDQLYFVSEPPERVEETPLTRMELSRSSFAVLRMMLRRRYRATYQVVRGVMFPTGFVKAQNIWLHAYRPDGQFVWLTDVSVDRWFPNGAHRINITSFPGEKDILVHPLAVIVAAKRADTPQNDAVWHELGAMWHGNLIVLKLSSDVEGKVLMFGNGEIEEVKRILKRWIEINMPARLMSRQ